MTASNWHDVIYTGCAIATFLTLFVIVATAMGWLQWSFSVKAVPPWNRKASEPRRTQATVPAAAEDAPAAGTGSNLRAAG